MNRRLIPSLSGLLTASFLLLAFAAVPMAQATVTYGGTEGVGATVFEGAGYSSEACSDCHDGVSYVALNSWATVNGYGGSPYACTTAGGAPANYSGKACIVYRINQGEMPTSDDLNSTGKSLITSWQSAGYPQTATAQVSTGAESGVSKYGATLHANVQENGNATNFDFEYGTTVAYGSNTSDQSPAGTGGGGDNKAISAAVSLNCGTTYQYRARTSSGSVTGSNRSLTTSACPAIGGIPDRSVALGTSITEDQSLSYNVSGYVSGTITNPGISYSLTTAPTGMTINSSGVISWPAASVPDAPTSNTNYTVTVRISDGTTTDTDTFVVTVTPVNDAPVIDTSVSPSTGAVEGVQYSYDVTATDVDSTITYSLNAAALSAGMAINSSSGLITWTPVNGGPSSVAVTATASDGTLSDTFSWTVTVTATNDPPTIINFNPPLTGTEDVTWSYQLEVSDIDDDAGTPGNISYTLSCPLCFGGLPSGMSVNTMGLITWRPRESQVADSGTTQFGPIRIQVEDGNEDGSTPTTGNNGIKTFTLTISPVNDAPVIGAISNQTVTEQSSFTLTPSVIDPDDSNDGTNLTWSLLNAPAGMTISNSAGTVGQISYTPGQNVVESSAPYNTLAYRDFAITVQVDDGHENGVTTATHTLNLRVSKPDTDSDLVANYRDNCVSVANTNQANNDGDANGDLCDTDDDNDGISDVAELANLLDPFDASDAAEDLDGDGQTNLQEFLVCVGNGDANCTDITNSLITNGDKTVVATGPYTPVAVSASAHTIENGEPLALDVTVSDDGPFRPGMHVLTWTATHPYTMAVMATTQQIVKVVPLASLNGNVMAHAGDVLDLPVTLSGESPAYPVDIKYEVMGATTSDTGTVTINGPDTIGLISVRPSETVTVTLLEVADPESASLSPARTSTLTVTGDALPPDMTVWASQDNLLGLERRNLMYRDQGAGYIDVFAIDRNGDTLMYDWSGSDPALGIGGESDAQAKFDVSTLSAGQYYDVIVRAFDSRGGAAEQRMQIAVADTAPTLASADTDGDGLSDDDPAEGLNDADGDGISDYLDPLPVPGVLLVQVDGTDDNILSVVQAGAGLGLVAGPYAAAAQGDDVAPAGGARAPASLIVDDTGAVVTDADYAPMGALYDVVMNSSLHVGGTDFFTGATTFQVTYSLLQPLAPQSTWRVFINGGWFTFVPTATDSLWSAPASADGQCPAPEDAGWQAGLVTGYTCVRIVYSDGGPNDSDGMVNASVHATGGAALSQAVVVVATPSSEKGSGSAGVWLLMMLSLLSFRVRRNRK